MGIQTEGKKPKGIKIAERICLVDLIVFQMICQHFFSKIRILAGIVVPFFFFSLNASAQSYIGGSFSLGSSTVGRNQTPTTWSRSTSFRLAPDVGWFIGDRWAVGIRPSVGFSSTINSDDVQSKSFSLGINPYARYRLLDHHRFGLWAEADPKISFEQVKSQARGGGWPSKSHSTFYDMDILPVLTYQLSRHISLESQLNLFSLFLNGVDHVDSNGYHQHSFSGGLRADAKDIVDNLRNITIGFLYKF